MEKYIIDNFNLKDTLLCGQIFRVELIDDYYYVILKDRIIKIKQIGKEIYVDSNNKNNLKEVIYEYFDLNRNYETINNKIIEYNPNIKDIIKDNIGLKIIKQDKFECIISYILSSNNSVNNIKNALDNISKEYGKKIEYDNKTFYLFPSINNLINVKEEDYRRLKCGFRDKYIKQIINNINNKEFDINKIDELNSNTALNYLMNQKGIGLKVASCILLFAYSRFDIFPIDTWVKKYMKEKYNIEEISKIKDYFINNYHEYCGLVIQYIFNYNRNK